MRAIGKGDPAMIGQTVADAVAGLHRLIAAYEDPAQCYLARPFPGAAPRFSDYALLARVAEWSAAGGEE